MNAELTKRFMNSLNILHGCNPENITINHVATDPDKGHFHVESEGNSLIITLSIEELVPDGTVKNAD